MPIKRWSCSAIAPWTHYATPIRTLAQAKYGNTCRLARDQSRLICGNMSSLEQNHPFQARIYQVSSLTNLPLQASLKDMMLLAARQIFVGGNPLKSVNNSFTYGQCLCLRLPRKCLVTHCRSSPIFMLSSFRTVSSKSLLQKAGTTEPTGFCEVSEVDCSGGASAEGNNSNLLLKGEDESVLTTLAGKCTGNLSTEDRLTDFKDIMSISSVKADHISEATRKLKAEFEAALSCFQQIPEALERLPKMNPNGVYANHNLRLDLINVYGFDYDYTLAHYTKNLQFLIYNLARDHLVKEHKYPATCLEFQYDSSFPIRGLYYDKKKGYLLKLDFFHCAEPNSCFFGRRRLTRAEIEAAYGGVHMSIEHMPNLVALMDLFCLSEVCLLSDVIQHFTDLKVDFDASYVYEDVKKSVEYVHRSGLMHKLVLEEPAKYLQKNDAIVDMLRTLKNRGKRLFILTNSPFPFVDGGMRFLFQEDGLDGDSWLELFDVVVALADKPNFYTSERPFRHYDSKKDILGFNRVETFDSQSVFYQGCLKNFLEITKWRGPEVLYFGDHLYSDLRGPAKAGWRTAAIIKELEGEIATQNKMEYRFQQAKYHIVQELLGKFHGFPASTPIGQEEKELLLALRKVRKESRLAMKALFNPNFGSAFLTDTGKESAFSYNVQRYADVYTSRLENLMMYSSEAWLYTPFDVKILPHHIKVGPSKLLKFRQDQKDE